METNASSNVKDKDSAREKTGSTRREFLGHGGRFTAGVGMATLLMNLGHWASPALAREEDHTSLDAHRRACIDDCTRCQAICVETGQYCMEKAGMHTKAEHVRLLQDCAELCHVTANLMHRVSDLFPIACGVCAEACDRCAKMCDELGMSGDMQMKACAKTCRRCAETCGEASARGHERGNT
jgi:hypothetical protein